MAAPFTRSCSELLSFQCKGDFFLFFKMFYCISSGKSVLPDIPSDISNILKFHVTI